MKRINDLRDLFIEQGRELYDATTGEERELPDTERLASNPKLKKILRQQLKIAKHQRSRLQDAFNKMNASLDGETRSHTENLLLQTQNLINRVSDPDVRDAAIVNRIQRLNHLKIASYGSLAAFANQMGEFEIAKAAHDAVVEERNIDLDLSKLAETEINSKAVHLV